MNIFSCQVGHRIKMRSQDARSKKARLQSHEVRFLNPTSLTAWHTVPSLGFFTWRMAVRTKRRPAVLYQLHSHCLSTMADQTLRVQGLAVLISDFPGRSLFLNVSKDMDQYSQGCAFFKRPYPEKKNIHCSI